jgi:hypothetical protein
LMAAMPGIRAEQRRRRRGTRQAMAREPLHHAHRPAVVRRCCRSGGRRSRRAGPTCRWTGQCTYTLEDGFSVLWDQLVDELLDGDIDLVPHAARQPSERNVRG